MALIKCTECGKSISDRAAACPGCGAPPPPVKLKAPVISGVPGSGVPLWQKVVGSLLVLGAIGSCISKGTKPSAPAAFSVADAMYLCDRAFRLVSKDPEKADVPYVQGLQSGDEILFSWGAGTKMLRMRNGLGLEVAASGSCAVSRSRKQVVSLTLNGETIL
ncbi:zinc-ribbon domain-containing protein [Hydrogenophaga sp. NH-16]|uniref:zinc-ribbon domain-containing protein n=1 Tax=Hydrogenophaga sp. NH-16 TaxID=2184519 RepID=UPI000FD71F18|nr:zinc-ribbon domain-containing protein [Hydrogenophaga sp. NH-16]